MYLQVAPYRKNINLNPNNRVVFYRSYYCYETCIMPSTVGQEVEIILNTLLTRGVFVF